jgi:ankyrin repeat protein
LNKKSIIICSTIIVAFVVLSITWVLYKEYHEQRLQQRLGIRYPVVRNDPELLQQMIKEGHSLDDGPLIYEAISNTRPNARERNYTLQEIQDWDTKASLLVEILIEHGADLNSTGGIVDWPPLAFAACWHLETVVEMLLKAGADPNLGIKADNNSPLHWAFVYFWDDRKNNRILELLVHYGADVNALDEHGDTSLHKAIDHEADISIIKLFLEAGADPSLKNKDGLTALDMERSCPDPNAEVVKLLEYYLREAKKKN